MRSYLPQGPLPAFYHYYPGVPAVVGVRAGERVNFCPAVWNTGLSADPPLFGVSISPKRFTHGLLLKARRFSASFHPHAQGALVHWLGSHSGREVDKGRAPHFPGHFGVPILEGAYAAYELELVVTVKELERTGPAVQRILGELADKWGLTAEGTQAVQLRFRKEAHVLARDVVPEHFKIQLPAAPAGRYGLRLVVRDRNADRTVVAEREFRIREEGGSEP